MREQRVFLNGTELQEGIHFDWIGRVVLLHVHPTTLVGDVRKVVVYTEQPTGREWLGEPAFRRVQLTYWLPGYVGAA